MIYLDNNATTKLAPEVREVINQTLSDNWGNPNSSYKIGRDANSLINNSRKSVANLIKAQPNELFFTSGATESNNWAFHTALTAKPNKKHIITTTVEHSSVLELCKFYENQGYSITYLSVNEQGMIDIEKLEKSLDTNTALVSIMWVNNETGVVFPVGKIAKICNDRNVLFHCDAVQAVGKLPISLDSTKINYLSISAHKIHGPKGIGALYVREGSPLTPFIQGGGQEFGLRGGTQNTAFIAGFAKATELATGNIEKLKKTKLLRDYLEEKLSSEIDEIYFNGNNSPRVANTTNFGILGIDSDILVNFLASKNIFVSSGSACHASTIAPSHVISAMKDYDRANEALRISLSVYSTLEEVEKLVTLLSQASLLF